MRVRIVTSMGWLLLTTTGCPNLAYEPGVGFVPPDQTATARRQQRDDDEARRRENLIRQIEQADSLDKFDDATLATYGRDADLRKRISQRRRQWYVEANPTVEDRIKNCIVQGQIWIGMNREQARASWGKPKDINRMVSIYRTSEQWVYGDFGPYLFFEDDILMSFHVSSSP